MSEVKAILSSRREDGELLYEQSIALDHANKFARLELGKAENLVEKLVEVGVRKDMACKLADLLPQNKEELQMLFPKERFVSDESLMEKIVSTIQEYGES